MAVALRSNFRGLLNLSGILQRSVLTHETCDIVLPEHNVAAGEKLVLLIQHVLDQEPLAPSRRAETPTHHRNVIIDSANQ